MRTMGATDLLVVTMSHSVSFTGKTWWMLMLVFRLLLVLLAGFSLFSDEQERFICNTIQPGCSNVCFDVFSPVSVLRLWLFHLVLLCLPHVLFAAYVLHKLLTRHYCDRSPGGSLENSSSSRGELSSLRSPLHDLLRECGAPRFYCAYVLAVILRILLEVGFGVGQFFLFGFSVPQRFLCYEAPCTSGVECYVSRPTEKSLMLNFTLAVASLSVLLSLMDLLSSVKAMVGWRRRRKMLMEEIYKGEQSSMLTTTTGTEDGDVSPSRRISPGGSSKDQLFPIKPNEVPTLTTGGCGSEKIPETRDTKVDTPPPPTPMSSPLSNHHVLHSHLRPPVSPRPDRRPPANPRMPTPPGVKHLGQSPPVGTNSNQRSDSGDSQDKRAWV